MVDDGRLLTLLGLLGVAGAAALRGSRGVVRKSDRAPTPGRIGYTLRIWPDDVDGSLHSNHLLDDLEATGSVVFSNDDDSGLDDAGMFWWDCHVLASPHHEAAVVAGLTNLIQNWVSSSGDTNIEDWSFEPTDGS